MTPHTHSSPGDPQGKVEPFAAPQPLTQQPWVRRFLARNPFYLVSAALLLFGINRLSVDPSFLGAEEPKLAFNFAALQLYEVLLVFVAIVLGLRKVWYDSTLLIVVENGLVLVPFILVTQAILIGKGLAAGLCVTGTLMAASRYNSLHRWMPELRLSPRLLGCGALVLGLNLALPMIFRPVIEADVDRWEIPGRVGWFCVLPLLAATANLLPRPRFGRAFTGAKDWLPLLIFSMWIAGTGVHLWSVGYVAAREFLIVYLLPVAWVVAWTLYNRVGDLQASPSPALRSGLVHLPFVVPILGLAQGNGSVAFWLTALNLGVYGGLALARRERQTAFQLLVASSALLLAALPLDWGRDLLPEFSRSKAIGLAFGAYVLAQAFLSRHVSIGLCGALVAGIFPGFLLGKPVGNEAIQIGCAFLLLHSFRWEAPRLGSAVGNGRKVWSTSAVLRFVTAVTWNVHAIAWTHSDETFSRVTVSSSAVAVLAGYVLFRLLRGQFPPRVLLITGSVSLCAVPINGVIGILRTSPVGLLSVMGSFILFGAGTLLAMNKHRWERIPARLRPNQKQKL